MLNKDLCGIIQFGIAIYYKKDY